jgi:hypothetical protein
MLPWVKRSDVDVLASSFSTQVEQLRGEWEDVVSLHARRSSARADQLERQLAQLSSDLTEMIGLRLVENAESHDVLATRIASTDAVLSGVAAHLNALDRSVASFSDAASARRKDLHDALAWYPTWSALAPLGSEPLVSVIVPTRDRRGLLGAALASLERQTYRHWEAVVVNDGSTDGTGELLDELSLHDERFRRFDTGGLGSGAARQYGLEQARGEVIAYLDDDNLMTDGWLRAVVESLVRSPELSTVYGGQLREMDGPRPWLLLEPFDELLLLEGNFIDIGAFAHRAIAGLGFRSEVDGFEDWDFILSFSEEHSIVPLPTIASVYMTSALGRVSVASGRHEVEEAVRSRAVRRRLADPVFVDRALRTLSATAPPRHSTGDEMVTFNDVEALVGIIRSVGRRREGPIRILVWDTRRGLEPVRAALGLHRLDVHWLLIGLESEPVQSSGSDEPVHWFDGSTTDPVRLAEAVLEWPVTDVAFDATVAVPPSDLDPSTEPYASLPARMGLSFDVVIIGGIEQRECLSVASQVVAEDGVVLLRAAESVWRDVEVGEFESWCAIGGEFWIGSLVQTDFTDLVPIRALLRGIGRGRASAG